MPPRPLHRWKSFWIGVFVVVFLGWAWWDSTRCETQIYLFGDEFVIVHARGETWVLRTLTGFWQQDWRYFHAERNYPTASYWNSWAPWELEYGWEITKIPHWFLILLILLFLLPWATWLVGRSRRVKRLSPAPGSAGPQTGPNGP